jgi:hypothetical protein
VLADAPFALLALLAVVLPGATLERQVGEWKAEAEALTFRGTELYSFMNGGAELYLEYGVESLETQRYQRGPHEIGVDLYRMGDGAHGLFTFLRPARFETVALGDAAFVADDYLLFVKGPFVCAVTAHSDFPGSREALLQVASAIAPRIEGSARRPEILSLLPERGRTPSSEKEVRGGVSLRRVSEPAADLVKGFEDGAVASYDPDGVGGILRFADLTQAERAWKRALDRSASGTRTTETVSFLESGASRRFAARRVGAFVVFASAADGRTNDELIAALEQGVTGQGAIPESERPHD